MREDGKNELHNRGNRGRDIRSIDNGHHCRRKQKRAEVIPMYDTKKENRAAEIALLTFPRHSEEIKYTGWEQVVMQVEKNLSEKRRAFLECRRDAECLPKNEHGKRQWVGYVQARLGAYYVGEYGVMCQPPCARTLRRWMDDCVEITVRTAIRMGVL